MLARAAEALDSHTLVARMILSLLPASASPRTRSDSPYMGAVSKKLIPHARHSRTISTQRRGRCSPCA